MSEISATMVKELRERTGLGMMECKKALTEANGDMKAAEDLLRIRSGAKASKAAGRIAAEGVVANFIEGQSGALVELNCETDFVAKNEDFLQFAKEIAQVVTQKNPQNVEALNTLPMSQGPNVEERRQALVMKLGENISVRRFVRFTTQGSLATYLHGTRIGVLVDFTGGDQALGKDIAMHIAAAKPVSLSAQDVSPELINREREIYTAQVKESGKPENMVEKIVEGKMTKYLAEVTLLGQPFIKNPDQTVEKLLAANKAKVNAFQMYVVGEGIEKKSNDFAAEVMAQAGQG